MKNLFTLIFIVLLLSACSVFRSDADKTFVTVKDTKLMLGDNPYYFVGTNFWYGCYLGSPGETGDRERLVRELDQLKELGITNLRILAASEGSEIGNSLKPAIQTAHGKINEELLIGLDFLLAEMGKRDMKAVVFLNNYWEWSGGMSQYLSWVTGEEPLDPEKVGWEYYMTNVAKFYRNKKAVEAYNNFLTKIITRTNTITGDKYTDDPAIMAWQLANEPRPGRKPHGFQHVDFFYKWVDETAAYIHSLDHNHLVTTGNEGTMGSMESEEVYIKAHSSKHIDYVTFHLWAKNWGWFKADNAESMLPVARKNATDYFNLHMKLARKLNKPITLEEFGLSRDLESYDPSATTAARDEYFGLMLGLVEDSCKAGAPISGTNFWAWGGEGKAQHKDYKWRKGDPFVGDPPQEPQGLNSVFGDDKSTLKILKEHSQNLQKIAE